MTKIDSRIDKSTVFEEPMGDKINSSITYCTDK